MARSLADADKVCARIVSGIFAVTFVTGASNLAVWLIPALHFVVSWPGVTIMRANSGLALAMGAVSLLAWHWAGRWRSLRWGAKFAGWISALIGMLTTIQYLANIDLGIDELIAPGRIPGDNVEALVVSPGRMSFNASLALALVGLALAGLDWEVRWRRWRLHLAPIFALGGALPAFLGIAGILLGHGSFTALLNSTNILGHTALCLLLMAMGVLVLRPRRQPVAGVFSAGADGVLLRLLVPGSIAVMLILAAVIGRGQARGFLGAGEGTALMLYGGSILLLILITVAGHAVRQQETTAARAGAALREHERLNQSVLNAAPGTIVILTPEGEVSDWNAAAEELFGWCREEITGRRLPGTVIEVDTWGALVMGHAVELQARRKSGESLAAEIVVQKLDGMQTPMLVAFIRDITDRKAAENALKAAKEQAEKASQAKDDFLAALSHELRTPLTPVLLSASALTHDPDLPAKLREELAMIERNVSLEARLIDDLLDLTRVSKGKLHLRNEECDVHALLGHAVEIVREEAQVRRLQVDLRLEATRRGVRGDATRLQQVFWNLLKNAVKFTEPGGRIILQTRDGEAGALKIECIDSGVGFSPEAAERIFQPFEQGAVTGERSQNGLGLGLAIASAIVRLHRGGLAASSPGVGQGATFTVALPDAYEIRTEQWSPGAGTLLDATVGNWRILLVEDHEPTRQVLARLLTRAGNAVQEAGSVGEAAMLAEAQPEAFDVLISDLGLPDGTGGDLMRRLRASLPALRGIALSGYGMEEDVQGSHEAGFSLHLVKPVRYEQIADALRGLRAQIENLKG